MKSLKHQQTKMFGLRLFKPGKLLALKIIIIIFFIMPFFTLTRFWWSILNILLTSNVATTCQQTLIRVLVDCLLHIC